jgi:hypothetical protein
MSAALSPHVLLINVLFRSFLAVLHRCFHLLKWHTIVVGRVAARRVNVFLSAFNNLRIQKSME